MRRGRDEEVANREGRREVVRAPPTDRDMAPARAALLHGYTPVSVCGCGLAGKEMSVATEARPHPMPPPQSYSVYDYDVLHEMV
jgi:hypothetical protein